MLCFVLLYGVLTFEKLTIFPCYFFCDEAINGVEAYGVLTGSHYSEPVGILWPKFFKGFGDYELALSVYLNVPFVKLFGLNEFAVRLTTAVISLIGVCAAYVWIHWIFKLRAGWLTFVVFAVSPLWFIHSRTGFHLILPVSFFLAFGTCYILAFSRHPLFVVPAAVFGAATFYCYTSARGWIIIALLLLLLVNFKRHLRYWKRTLIGSLLIIGLLGPYIHLHITHPDIAMKRLTTLRNYTGTTEQLLMQRIPALISNYINGLNPIYWYSWKKALQPGTPERHVIPQFPHLFFWTLPFMIIGLGVSFWQIRAFEYRTLLALLAAVPVPAALAQFNQLRAMPVGVLFLVFALIGMGWIYRLLKNFPRLRQALSIILFIVLGIYAVWFRNHVYQKAMYEYSDYGFYGVQMGAPEVFAWIQEYAPRDARILLSPQLFNAGDIFIPFYLRGTIAQNTQIFDAAQLCKTSTPAPERAFYIVPASFFEWPLLRDCPLIKEVVAEILDKRQKPLFHIVTIQKPPQFDAWLQQLQQERTILQTDSAVWQDRPIKVEHSRFDMGNVQALFDGALRTFARTDQVNPARCVIHLPEEMPLKKVKLTTSHVKTVKVAIKTSSSGQTVTPWNLTTTTMRYDATQWPYEEYIFEPPEFPQKVNTIEIAVTNTLTDQYGHVHIQEITWEK